MKSDLFNIGIPEPRKPRDPEAAAPPAAPGAGKPTGVLTARQSAITFAGAPAVVTLIWRVLGSVFPNLAENRLLPLLLSLLVGLLIYFQSETGATGREKAIGLVYAVINSFAIAATTLGIDTLA